jgi:hypothetical protein
MQDIVLLFSPQNENDMLLRNVCRLLPEQGVISLKAGLNTAVRTQHLTKIKNFVEKTTKITSPPFN